MPASRPPIKPLYKWKRQARSYQGSLIFNGVAVRFRYRQTGVADKGRILFEKAWLDELKSVMEGRSTKHNRSIAKQLDNISVAIGTPPV
jgi:hypothetical protein